MFQASPRASLPSPAEVQDREAARPSLPGWGARAAALVKESAPFLAVAAQFGLIVLLVLELLIESRSFGRVMKVGLVGFLVHHFLPLRWRMPFFVALSLATTMIVIGVAPAVVLVGIGLALIGLCHLPIRFAARVA